MLVVRRSQAEDARRVPATDGGSNTLEPSGKSSPSRLNFPDAERIATKRPSPPTGSSPDSLTWQNAKNGVSSDLQATGAGSV